MGKYMKKKSKVALMVEGVRTRAKTLALKQRLSNLGVVFVDESSFCYLQLRSRRLEKAPPPSSRHKLKTDNRKQNQDKGSESLEVKEVEYAASNELGLHASFGDNPFYFENRDRSTRESTPCSLIRGCDTIGTPGSTTRRTGSTTGRITMAATNQGVQSDVQRLMPTAQEIEEFFASVEEQQHRLFMEKYNFDIVNDLPLPGRYEWVQVMP